MHTIEIKETYEKNEAYVKVEPKELRAVGTLSFILPTLFRDLGYFFSKNDIVLSKDYSIELKLVAEEAIDAPKRASIILDRLAEEFKLKIKFETEPQSFVIINDKISHKSIAPISSSSYKGFMINYSNKTLVDIVEHLRKVCNVKIDLNNNTNQSNLYSLNIPWQFALSEEKLAKFFEESGFKTERKLMPCTVVKITN